MSSSYTYIYQITLNKQRFESGNNFEKLEIWKSSLTMSDKQNKRKSSQQLLEEYVQHSRQQKRVKNGKAAKFYVQVIFEANFWDIIVFFLPKKRLYIICMYKKGEEVKGKCFCCRMLRNKKSNQHMAIRVAKTVMRYKVVHLLKITSP